MLKRDPVRDPVGGDVKWKGFELDVEAARGWESYFLYLLFPLLCMLRTCVTQVEGQLGPGCMWRGKGRESPTEAGPLPGPRT